MDEVTVADVKEFWSANQPGIRRSSHEPGSKEFFTDLEKNRYGIEPYIVPFADFGSAKGKRVLEIGVGLGTDHVSFARAGADLFGIDLVPDNVKMTGIRLEQEGLKSNLVVGNAEQLEFEDDTFDAVYSYGVIHHTPHTQQCIDEIYRVLKPGGKASIMVYHAFSLANAMTLMRGVFRGILFKRGIRGTISYFLEEPGEGGVLAQIFTRKEARAMVSKFSSSKVWTQLSPYDVEATNLYHPKVKLNPAVVLRPIAWIPGLRDLFGHMLMIQVTK